MKLIIPCMRRYFKFIAITDAFDAYPRVMYAKIK